MKNSGLVLSLPQDVEELVHGEVVMILVISTSLLRDLRPYTSRV